MSEPLTCLNYIDGHRLLAQSGATLESRNPADWREKVATFPRSGAADVAAAVGAARKADQKWLVGGRSGHGVGHSAWGRIIHARCVSVAPPQERRAQCPRNDACFQNGKLFVWIFPVACSGPRLTIAN